MVGQKFLDEYNEAYGRRPEWCVPVVNRDVACTLLRALSDAHPLSPRGLKDALERVKMMPPRRVLPEHGCRSVTGAGGPGWVRVIWWHVDSMPTASIPISSIASARSSGRALLRLVRYAWEQLARRPCCHPAPQLRSEMGCENRAIEDISDHHDSDDRQD